ncbi:MAG: sugar transferase [Planctomycetaceae bacterium]|jgi:lipopolysaccharide/colanic/teichoic acid biosynthesis glycosyltransferase|nr:sugar transferase [Planctomycetaceae bacterium]
MITENCPEPIVSSYFRRKDIFDWMIALFLFIFTVPIIVVTIVIVRLTSKGPGIYKQVRLGKDGKAFMIYKIRSMRVDAESATGPIWAARKDQRVTLVGKLIRKTHIDELPQLYNVLRGDMALVGPRPERPEFVNELEKRIDGYFFRLSVKPGVTGLAQLNQDSDINLNDVRQKLVYDFEYIEKASFRFDVRLLCGSALKVFRLCNPWTLKLLGLYYEIAQSPWSAPLQVASSIIPKDEERLSGIFEKRVAS